VSDTNAWIIAPFSHFAKDFT